MSTLTNDIIEILKKELIYLIRDELFKTNEYLLNNVAHFANICLLLTHPDALSIEDEELADYMSDLQNYVECGGFARKKMHRSPSEHNN
jgi:hypothetical protein